MQVPCGDICSKNARHSEARKIPVTGVVTDLKVRLDLHRKCILGDRGQVNWSLSTKGVDQGPAGLTPPESLLEMQNLWSGFRSHEPESAF